MKKWECTVCGYIHEGDAPPNECPVCSADKSMFVEITVDSNTTEQVSKTVTSQRKPTLLAAILATASELILKHHLHPITVHTPNGIVPMAVLFSFTAMFLHLPLFGTAALYSLVFVLLVIPVVFFTGYSVWQKRYQGALTSIFKIKIGASIVIALILPLLIIWQFIQPEIVVKPLTGRWIYLGLSLLLLAAVGLAGHMGGKLVFGNRK